MSPSNSIHLLVQQIETQLGWGAGAAWTNKDFQDLSAQIFERTHQQLSVTTLKRVWGRAERVANPSRATLDILAEFAGYDSWRAFRQQYSTKAEHHASSFARPLLQRRWIVGIIGLMATVGVAWYVSDEKKVTSDNSVAISSDVEFSFEKVTTGYPNTVIFRYDVGDLPYDSLTLQQSWDARKQMTLTEPQGLVTATYYAPGYYLTKLLVNDQIVREAPLYIPTQGWQGLVVESDEELVYLDPEQLRYDSTLCVTPGVLNRMNQSQKSLLYLANLTDDPQIDGANFSLDTEFRMTRSTERSVCQYVRLTVTGTREVLGFHFSVPGCVGDLMFMLNQEMVAGRDHDLSAFGLDLSAWTQCRLEVHKNQLQLWLNGEEVFVHTLDSDIGKVGGVQWTFEGLGEIRRLGMEDGVKSVDLMRE